MMSIQADDARAVALGAAIRSGDVESLERHLRDLPELATARVVDARGVSWTLLHLAADSVEQLTNAFWHACRGGQQRIAEYLLDRGADLNWVGHDRKTPCDVAQASGDANLVGWLRARGAKSATELK